MPKSNFKLALNLNLLRPQSNPEKLPVKFLHWLLSSGRYLFVLVNGLVLIAFIGRFKLDADLASNKEAIEEQIPYIESMKPYEILIRNTQLKLSTIANINTNSLDWSRILKKIADQTPTNVKITSINVEKNVGAATIRINGQTQNNNEITGFISGLKTEDSFTKVSLVNIGLEQDIIKFTIDALAKLTGPEAKNL